MRVLLIDDSPVFLERAVSLVRASDRVAHVALARSGEEGLARAADEHPDLILVDVVMPGLDGFETARRLKALPRPARVVMVSLSDQPAYGRAALAAGADGFVAKGDLPRVLGDLLRPQKESIGD